MITEIQETKKEYFFIDVLIILVRFILGYVSYAFLTLVIGLSFLISGWTLISIIYQFNESFIRLVENFFKFINVANFSLSGSFGISEVMKIYLLVSLIFAIIVEIGKFVFKKYFNKEIKYSFKRKIIFNITLIHIIYITALIMIIFTKFFKETNISWFFVLALFYIINIVTLGGYLFIAYLKQLIETYLRHT